MSILDRFIKNAQEDNKVDRSAFLYMEPKNEENRQEFAQCSTCMMWLYDVNKCSIHGENVEVTGDMSCSLYVEGKPMTAEEHPPMPLVTPEESGLVSHPVRCENCTHFDGIRICNLYVALNRKVSDLFDLDTNVDPNGCCNANKYKG